MPRWSTHKKWALRLGIPDDIAEYVNKLIDGETLNDFVIFCYKKESELRSKAKSRRSVLTIPLAWIYGRHDVGRRKKTAAYLQLEFLAEKGEEYVEAWYLHHILDYLEKSILPFDNAIDKFLKEKIVSETLIVNKQLDLKSELNKVLRFVKENRKEITKDLGH